MGSGRWTDDDWKRYSTKTTAGKKSVHEIFTAGGMAKELNPLGVLVRESRDSTDNPESTAIMVGHDVTGSMAVVLEDMIRNGLNTFITELYGRKPVKDPHLLIGCIGDVEYDRAPLQVTQFEADIRVAEQLAKMYLEQGGGGNMYESYSLFWYFGAMHTSIDCFEKRGKKGYLFTIGDEEPTPSLTRGAIKAFIGDTTQTDFSSEELLVMANRTFNVFHLMVEKGSNYTNRVPEKWRRLLGQRAIPLADHTKLAEVLISTIQVNEGHDKDTVINSWSKETALVVSRAVKDVAVGVKGTNKVVRF